MRVIAYLLAAIFVGESAARLELTGEEAAQLVRDEFRYAYESYLKYAKGYDELRPLWFNGSNWFAFTQLLTPIDSLSTLALMRDQQDLLNETLALVCNFDWDTVNTYVNMFELVIRNVGGLLSAYWLTGQDCLKQLVIELGERIWDSAFMQPNSFSCQTDSDGRAIAQIPWNYINIANGSVLRSSNVQDMAAFTTNLVEFGCLSVLTGDIKYYRAAKDIMRQIIDISSDLNLPGRKLDVLVKDKSNLTQLWPDQGSHIDAGIDSYFEYMIKCYALFGDEECLEWWNISYAAILQYMSHDDGERLWFKRVLMQNGEDTWDVGHYDLHAHFFASVVALAGDMDTAKRNQEANHFMWNVQNSKVTPFNYDFLQQSIVQTHWDLNPEIMESNYYLYAMTKEQVYFDRALQYLEDVMNATRCYDNSTCVGYSALHDVNASNIVRKNRCQSFFYSETYKYLYLTFLANTTDGAQIFDFHDYIFNTEAQPLPKAWGQQLLQMDLDNDELLPANYNNCPLAVESALNAQDVWILLNVYGAAFVVLLLCAYLAVQLVVAMRSSFRVAYSESVFHGVDASSVQQAKSTYFMLSNSWLSVLFAFCAIISIMFFQTDAFVEWDYNPNDKDSWSFIKWSFIAAVTFYFYSKLTMYFAFSLSMHSAPRKFGIVRVILGTVIAGIIIAECVLYSDDFTVTEIVSSSDIRIRAISVDPLTFVRIIIAILILLSLIMLRMVASKIRELKYIQQETPDLRSFADIYITTKCLLLMVIANISMWIFTLMWSIGGDELFVVPCTAIDLVVGTVCLLLLNEQHSRIYFMCCQKCHISCTKCCGVYQKYDEKKLKKIAAFGMKADLRTDSMQLAPLEQAGDHYYDASQQTAFTTDAQ